MGEADATVATRAFRGPLDHTMAAFDTQFFNVERRTEETRETSHEIWFGRSRCIATDPHGGAADSRLGASKEVVFWRRDGIGVAENDRIPSPNRSFSEP